MTKLLGEWRVDALVGFYWPDASRPMIRKEEAVDIARAEANAKGWSFAEPVRCTFRRGWFGGRDCIEIETNAGGRGTKVRFSIDAETGAIIDQGYLPR